MLLTIIIKEIRNNLLNTRITICYAAVVALTLFTMAASGLRYARELDKAQGNTDRFAKEMTADAEENWWTDYNVQVPPRPLAVLGEGFNREISRPYHVGIDFAAVKPLGKYLYTSPIFRIFDVYDPATVTAVILSLLALFISFDAVSRERETGTMRLLLANPVSKGTFILGKAVGGYLTVAFPYLLSLTAGMLFLAAGLGLQFTGAHYLRIGMFTALALAYLAVFFFTSMFLSVLFQRSSTALFTLVCVWIALVFVAPHAAVWTGAKLAPFDTTAAYHAVLRRIVDEENAAARKEHAPYKGTAEADSKAREIWTAAHHRMGDRWNAYLKGHKAKVRHQVRTGASLARVSPPAAFLLAATTVFRTGPYDYLDSEEWKFELTAASKVVADEFNNRQGKKMHEWRERNDGTEYVPEKFDLSTLPNRHYPGLGMRACAGLVLPDLLVLCLESVALFMAAFITFIRRQGV